MINNKYLDVWSLIELLEQKYKLLNSILKLTKQQGIAINENDIECLEELTGSRNEIINKVNIIDDKFLLLFNKIKDEHKINELGELKVQTQLIEKLKGKTNTVNNMLLDIKKIEKENIDNLNDDLLNVKEKLKKVIKGKKASNNYHKKISNAGGTFIDKKE